MNSISERLAKEHPHEFNLMQSVDLEKVEFLVRGISEDWQSDGESAAIDSEYPPGVAVVTHGGVVCAAIVVYIKPPIARIMLPVEYGSGAGDHQMDQLDRMLRSLQLSIAERMDQKASELAIIAIPHPIEYVGPGDSAHCGASPATFGVQVNTVSGSRGILTAGHAAPVNGGGAYDANANLIGKVVDTQYCARVGPGVTTADVAVIELLPHVLDGRLSAPVASGVATGAARLGDTVTAYGSVTSGRSAPVLAAGTPFRGTRPDGGNFGEAFMTLGPISAPGDSGAPVFNQAGLLVGHVVAGYPGVYSIVQDADYQMAAVGATLR